jgi:hypothetical protein
VKWITRQLGRACCARLAGAPLCREAESLDILEAESISHSLRPLANRHQSNRDTEEWLTVVNQTLLAQSTAQRFVHNAYDLVVVEWYGAARGSSPSSATMDPPPKRRATTSRRSEDRDVAEPLDMVGLRAACCERSRHSC